MNGSALRTAEERFSVLSAFPYQGRYVERLGGYESLRFAYVDEVRVNLIPYHGTGNDLHISSSHERMMNFKHNLVISGISASIRKSRGVDISAACGLLASGLK